MSTTGIIVSGLIALWAGTGWITDRNVERPPYDVISSKGRFEIRHYSQPLALAQTSINSNDSQALGQGFRRLAGYIFAGNTSNESIPMTAPVLYTQQSQSKMYFVLPTSMSAQNAPIPNASSVNVTSFEWQYIVAIRFKGYARPRRVAKFSKQLRQFCDDNQLTTKGSLVVAQYNSPWTFPLIRKNEIWVEITAPTSNEAP